MTSNIFYEMLRLFRKRGTSYNFKNSQLNPRRAVPGLTLQVYTPQLAMYVKTDSTRSKTCIYEIISWNCLWMFRVLSTVLLALALHYVHLFFLRCLENICSKIFQIL